jgi:two-component system OmpR family response regulator
VSPAGKPCVLVVDDDPLQLELVERSLRLEGFEVVTTSSPMGVSNLVRSTRPAVVLLDLDLPAIPGEKLLELARRQSPSETRFVLYSACDEAKLRRLAVQYAADAWICKSTVGAELAGRLRAMLATER